MKTARSRPLLVLAALCTALPWPAGCSRTDGPRASAPVAAATPDTIAAGVRATAAGSWDHIKGYGFDKRSDFVADLNRMTGVLDDNMSEMNARFLTLTGDPARHRVAASRELDDARSDLKSKLADLGDATVATWTAARARVAASWARVQTAYAALAATAVE